MTNNPVSQEVAELIRAAYLAGATDVHDAWIDGNGQTEADFGEAASDYVSNLPDLIPTAPQSLDGLVERVAQSLHRNDTNWSHLIWCDVPAFVQNDYKHMASVAIDAITGDAS